VCKEAIMRKRIGETITTRGDARDETWLDLDKLCTVEVSSEDPAHPVEHALVDAEPLAPGWRAGDPGTQTLLLRFDRPQRVQRIGIEIDEPTAERTQELAIAWRSADGERREIVRQRWNFSPAGSVREREDYRVDLQGVAVLEITVEPDVANRHAVASIAKLRVA
jgi:hypothetical protein